MPTALIVEDEPEANELLAMLERRLPELGLTPFIDRHLKIGVEWAQSIEKRIRSAQAVIVLISAFPLYYAFLLSSSTSASIAQNPIPSPIPEGHFIENITRVLTADGVVSLIGCLMGNPFINAVYIGHPGWKAMGGRIGYSAATGVMTGWIPRAAR
mgnify:CR=1 FL=1